MTTDPVSIKLCAYPSHCRFNQPGPHNLSSPSIELRLPSFHTAEASKLSYCLIFNCNGNKLSPTVVIGFQQAHYKVDEGDGCVEVCIQILSGHLGRLDSISVRLITADDTAVGRFAYLLTFAC